MTLTDTVPFSRSDVQLVQSILQTPDALITGVALDGFHSRSAEALKVSGVLQPDGHQLAAVSLSDHDDEAVTLTWSPEEGGYGYFNPEKGWVSVPSPSLQTYAVDMKAVLGRLFCRLDLPSNSRPVERVPGLLWEIGDVRLPGRSGRSPVWFARRLSDRGAWDQVGRYLSGHPPADFRVVVSASPIPQFSQAEINRHDFIHFQDIDTHDTGLVIDPSSLAAQITTGASSNWDEPVRHASGFRHFWVGDREFRFNGDKQRQVVEYLFYVWGRGETSVSSARLFSDLEFETSSRLRDLFKGHKDWKDLIETQKGSCRLKVEELLEAQRAIAD